MVVLKANGGLSGPEGGNFGLLEYRARHCMQVWRQDKDKEREAEVKWSC